MSSSRVELKGYTVTFTKPSEKHFDRLWSLPNVDIVTVGNFGVYYVRFLTRTRKSVFKRVPYIENITPYKAGKIVKDDSSESSEELMDPEEIAQKKAVRKYMRLTDAMVRANYLKNEREADARLRREEEDIEVEDLIGFTTDTPDERSERPEKRFFRKKLLDDQYYQRETDENPVVKRINKVFITKPRERNAMIQEYYANEDEFFRKYPSYCPY